MKELRYTFNVARGGALKASRSWVWRPVTGEVIYRGPGEGGVVVEERWTAHHPAPDEAHKDLDHAFVNDQYWLLFPFLLVWDEGRTLTDLGRSPTPFGGAEGARLAVQYAADVGYTPGDRYDVWAGEGGVLTHWTYTPAGADGPRLASTWAPPQALGPLSLSLSHVSEDGGFHLWFTEVTVVTDGGTFSAEGEGLPAAPAAP